ncbi:isochorismatase family protein [Caulobacter sp. KR2-114]|uniref:isochorismatase family protein n=1 Tax=Caulobacter sp. KR2-114 TaxID=3400912 RepID=UPI003BFC092E
MSSPPPAPVLVIDLQTGMFASPKYPPIHDADTLTARARRVIAWARGGGRPVAFVRHDGEAGDELAPGEAGWPVWPALGQQDGEPTFSKSVGDAFSQPALVRWIEDMGADGVVLLGAQTEHCVTATVNGALARGLKVTVVGDAHSTWDFKGETAGQIIDRQNRAFAEAGATVVTSDDLVKV